MMEEGEFAGFLGGRVSDRRSRDKVRPVPMSADAPEAGAVAEAVDVLGDDDEIWRTVRKLIADEFGGVILVGAPGTSKSWYAELIAKKLTKDRAGAVRFVQFHPSYQYEDFVEGYVPDPATQSFKPERKHLLVMSEAADTADEYRVIVVDELSRADPARVFGEALTYVEQSKRGKEFYLASGRTAHLAPKLFIIATMNEFDRGIDDVDAAFDRRMAKIRMLPSADLVARFLADASMEGELAGRVVAFFNALQRSPVEAAKIGHTYFRGLKTEEDLRRRWDVQLSYVLRKAFGINRDGFAAVERSWARVFPRAAENSSDAAPAAESAMAAADQMAPASGAAAPANDSDGASDG